MTVLLSKNPSEEPSDIILRMVLPELKSYILLGLAKYHWNILSWKAPTRIIQSWSCTDTPIIPQLRNGVFLDIMDAEEVLFVS